LFGPAQQGKRLHVSLEQEREIKEESKMVALSHRCHVPALFFTVTAVLLFTISAVDRSKFRKCDELGFCRDHRDLKRSYHYVLDPKSFKV